MSFPCSIRVCSGECYMRLGARVLFAATRIVRLTMGLRTRVVSGHMWGSLRFWLAVGCHKRQLC
jgi:hypothetical protein